MKIFKSKLTVMFGATALIFTALIALPVLAEATNNGGNYKSVSMGNSPSTHLPKSDTPVTPLGRTVVMNKKIKDISDNEKTENKKIQTDPVKIKSCEDRKVALNNRMSKAIANADKHKALFDKVYVKIKKLHDDKGLSSPDYAALVVKADAAKANAEASIVSLKALNFNIDCTQNNVATQVAAFKAALGDTRDKLKAYRTSIKNIMKSLDSSNEANEKNDAPKPVAPKSSSTN